MGKARGGDHGRGVEGKGRAQADGAGHTWDALGRQVVRACLGLHGGPKHSGRGLGAIGQAEVTPSGVHLGFYCPTCGSETTAKL